MSNPAIPTNFQNSETSLQAAAKAYQADDADITRVQNEIKEEVAQIAKKDKGNPMEELYALIELNATKKTNLFELHLKKEGDGIEVQKDITSMSNDIQSVTNGSTKLKGINAVKVVAMETDKMQDILTPEKGDTSWHAYVQQALGGKPSSMLAANFKKIRDDINWSTDPDAKSGYNPKNGYKTPPTPDNPSSYTSYHFNLDPGGSEKFLTSYSEMRKDLAGQGNPKDAQGASKILTNSYDQNVSTTNSLAATAKSKISLDTNNITAQTNGVTSLCQDILTANKTAVGNQITR